MKPRGPEHGFSLLELLATMMLIAVLTALAVLQLLDAFDRSRQRTTMADMRSIAVATGTFRVDNGEYPADLDTLDPLFMQPVPPRDSWGAAWTYETTLTEYTLSSLGSDGAAGPAPPADWYAEPYEADIVVTDDVFTQAPRGQQ